MQLKLALGFGVLSISIGVVQAGISPLQSQRLARMAPADGPVARGMGTFDQKLDPSDPSDTRTFKQRYFVNSTYAIGPNAPVFYYICGEANCFPDGQDSAPYPPLVLYEAAQYGGYIVMLEHRYFGKSQPFETMTTENLKFLRIEYALEDLATFQRWLMRSRGLTGKWISIGGSYPGALSAYYRLKHPELVAGALASSAPVRAKVDFEDYDRYVAKGLDAQCLRATQNLNSEVEQILYDPGKLAEVESLFGIRADQVGDPRDVLGFMEYVTGTAVQYGQVKEYCDTLLSGDALQEFAAVSKSLLALTQTSVLDALPQGSASTAASDHETGVGFRQWSYITCTQLGDFSTPNSDSTLSAESRLLDLAYNEAVCSRLFPGIDLQGMSQTIDAFNQSFYEPLLRATTTNILFTNGSIDPWSSLSISPDLGNNTHPGTKTSILPGGSHCSDLEYNPDSAPAFAKGAIDLITKSIGDWLK